MHVCVYVSVPMCVLVSAEARGEYLSPVTEF